MKPKKITLQSGRIKTSDFDYDLPKDFIAQDPLPSRDSSKLLVFDSKSGEVCHRHFRDIVDYLGKDDALVVNRSKVIPARVTFEVNGAEKEVFLLRKKGENVYRSLVRPGDFFTLGRKFKIHGIEGEVLEIFEDGTRLVSFSGDVLKEGHVPLPPYIKNQNVDFERYQTVYAKEAGSVAAPTAGLHFTDGLIDKLVENGVEFEEVILHVGRGTFLPIITENIQDHVMHSEFYELSSNTASSLNAYLNEGKRVVAVGTTSVRVLESVFDDGFEACSGETDIFIYPGSYQWKVVNSLITNFHLPKSTLIMLVASFLESKGIEDPVAKVLDLYEIAKKENYRFYSFGDAMLII